MEKIEEEDRLVNKLYEKRLVKRNK
jgi:hypothetical protein